MDTESVSDHTLVRQVAAGDQTALRELIDRHHGWLLMRLRRRTPDPELAASAAQDTFVALWTNARRYRGDGEVGAWLWGIAIRQLASRVRVRSAPAPVSSQVISALSPSVRSAEDELLLAIEHGDLGTALNNLSPNCGRCSRRPSSTDSAPARPRTCSTSGRDREEPRPNRPDPVA